MATAWIKNEDCYHSWGPHHRRNRCSTYMEQAGDGTWYAKCAAIACTTDGGEAKWRAGSRSGVFTYEQLHSMAVQHCLKHHSER